MQSCTLTQLLLYFLKLGTTGFGGPIALIGYMEKDLVEKKGWLSRKEFLHGLALAQIVPGPVAQQMAIYFGWLKGRIWGATAAGIAFILPPFLIVWGLSYLYVRYQGLPWVHSFFYGMGASVIAIMIQSAIKLIKISLEKRKGLWFIFLLLTLTTVIYDKTPILLFFAGGLLAVLFYAFPKGRLFTVLPLELFLFFFKSALVVYGSGIAIFPFIYHDVVQTYAWLNDKQFLDAVVIGMITPGPVLISVGFMGYLTDRLTGALSATIGIFSPVYLFVIFCAPWFHKILRNTQVQAFVEGVTASACGAIVGASFIFGRKAIVDWPTILIAVASLCLVFKTKIPSALILLGAGVAGIGISICNR